MRSRRKRERERKAINGTRQRVCRGQDRPGGPPRTGAGARLDSARYHKKDQHLTEGLASNAKKRCKTCGGPTASHLISNGASILYRSRHRIAGQRRLASSHSARHIVDVHVFGVVVGFGHPVPLCATVQELHGPFEELSGSESFHCTKLPTVEPLLLLLQHLPFSCPLPLRCRRLLPLPALRPRIPKLSASSPDYRRP